MESATPSFESFAWKSIIKGRGVIKRGEIWTIGDGRTAKIWGDRWLLVKHPPKILSPHVDSLPKAKVCILIDQECRSWNGDMLDATWLGFVVDMVKKIPLCYTDQPNELTWPYNANGAYSVKFGYTFL